MRLDKAHVLPPSLPPRGLSRVEAAAYCELSVADFEDLVLRERLPLPKKIDRRRVWDRLALDLALADDAPLVAGTPGTIYVVGFADFVKIGWSANPDKRKLELEIGLPLDLTTYARMAGTIRQEKALQRRFRAHRLRREWFRNEGEVAAWIAQGCPL